MIALSLLIALLASCGYLVGAPILARLSRGSGLEWGADGAFLSIWLGVVILADALLAVSLAAPLTPPVAAGVFAALFLLSLLFGVGSSGVPLPYRRVSAAAVLGTVILVLGVSAYCSQVIVYYDTRLYHMQSIKWLSHYGLVPGEALIHQRLAYISAWFAPAAAFDHGVMEGRAASAGGAFSLFMLVAHLLVALRRVARGEGRPTDSFLAAAAIPTLAVTLLFGLPNSASPDLPVFVLVIEGALAMLLVSARGHEEEPGTTPWHARLVPVIIGAGATALKLSALPLLALALCYYARPQPTLKKVAAAGAAVALFLLPVAAAGIVTSGCAFYPAPYICLDLPWSLGSAQAAAESLLIRDWARWDGLTPAGATSWNWLPSWLAREKGCSALLLLSALSVPALWLRRVRRHPGSSYVVWLACCGTAFMLYAGPTWRFGLGYLVLLPALALSTLEAQPEPARAAGWRRYLGDWALMATATSLLLATHIYLVPRPTFRALDQAAARMAPGGDHPHFNLLRPPRLWHVDFTAASGNGEKSAAAETILSRDTVADVSYYHPATEETELCWDGPLPCSRTRLSEIRLRDPAAGLAGGFVRTPATPPQ